ADPPAILWVSGRDDLEPAVPQGRVLRTHLIEPFLGDHRGDDGCRFRRLGQYGSHGIDDDASTRAQGWRQVGGHKIDRVLDRPRANEGQPMILLARAGLPCGWLYDHF